MGGPEHPSRSLHEEGEAELWDVTSASRRIAIVGAESEWKYYAIAISPDGRALATGGLTTRSHPGRT